MNIGKTVAGLKIEPSFKLWWNRYYLKVEVRGNNLIYDAMLMKDIYKFQEDYCWHTMKFAWNKNFTIYFSDDSVGKKFIRRFYTYIIKAQGVRTQDELDVINSDNKLLRQKLFFNKYRYMTYKYYADKKFIKKVENLNMNARVNTSYDGWKCTIYMSNKKDVAKLQLTIGTKGYLKKVVLTDEL